MTIRAQCYKLRGTPGIARHRHTAPTGDAAVALVRRTPTQKPEKSKREWDVSPCPLLS